MGKWNILCDFDGTIAIEDATDALLDASREEIDSQLAGLRIDPAFPAFADAVMAAGLTLSVISDGLDYAIKSILDRHGLHGLPVQANRLVQVGERSWKLETPFADANCRVKSGHCKCVSAVRAHNKHRRVLLIGDGASDFCAASEADFVFAKHRLIEHCRHADIPHVSIVGFADAIGLLPALLAGKLHTSQRVLVPETAAH